jgi:hypothetical protein
LDELGLLEREVDGSIQLLDHFIGHAITFLLVLITRWGNQEFGLEWR